MSMLRGPSLRTTDGRVRRRRVAVLVAVIVLALVVIVLLVIEHHRHHHHGASSSAGPVSASTGATTSSSSSTSPRVAALATGITFGGRLSTMSAAQVDRALDDVVALHMNSIRIDLSWASLQPSSAASWNWAPVDRIVSAAGARHLVVLGLLTYTPAWARARGCTSFTCPPRSDAQFARFAAAVVARYAPRGVRSYQLWNEPNIEQFWQGPDAASYRGLLDAAVPAMRRAASGLRVLFGGLAYTGTSAGNIAPATFLDEACRTGHCPVDAVGYDPYTYPGLPSATQRFNPWQLVANPAAGSNGLLATMQRVGLGSEQVWVTGFGAPTPFPGSDDSRLVSPARQSSILTAGLTLAEAPGSHIAGFFVDTLRDSAVAGTRRDHFGIEQADGAHKPAFAALARALAP